MCGLIRNINFTRQQWLVTITFIVVNFCNAMCVSMQAPFYPHEAEKKGCVPSEYGLVFGIFELTVFLVSPIIGANLKRMGMKVTLNVGIGTVGVTSILFGLLDKIQDGKVFLGLSFALRIIEACGNSGFLTGSFSMIAKEFPNNVATMFAILETFFGIGMILGPTVGGALYEAGGFTLPFAVLGGVLVCAAIFTSIVLPNTRSDTDATEKPSITQALKVPSIVMASYSVTCAAISLGFIQATLEPHLRDFKLSPLLIGSMFVVTGGTYGISAPLWGIICDRKPPKLTTIIGGILVAISFILLGPLPILKLNKSIPLIIVALMFHGIGMGAEVVSGFADAHKSAIAAGFPDTIDTYGLISGLWTSVFALGAFIGPTVAGILFDAVGFPWAALFVIITQLMVVVLLTLGFIRTCFKRGTGAQSIEPQESTSLLGDVEENEDQNEDRAYGSTSDMSRQERRQRSRNQRRPRKYSEAISGSVAGSMAKSFSMAYPQFMMPGVNTASYRNPPPSISGIGAMGGSAVDRIGAEPDSLLVLPEYE